MKKIITLLTLVVLHTTCIALHPASAQQPARMRINGIEMNSVYGQSIKTLSTEKQSETEVSFITNSNYLVNFYPLANTFTITITNPDFHSIRPIAEQALLSKLDIDPEQACFLDIKVGTPASVNPSLADKDYPLSFCEPKMRADINKDSRVDEKDIAICTNPKESIEDCDFNLDDHINALDYSYLLGVILYSVK